MALFQGSPRTLILELKTLMQSHKNRCLAGLDQLRHAAPHKEDNKSHTN